MRVLITRPEPDAAPLAAALAALGHDAVLAPLMHIAWTGEEPPENIGRRRPVFTSVNGVRAWSARIGHGSGRAFAVGPASGAAAAAEGFSPVAVAGGDVRSLAALIRDLPDARSSRFVHVAGTHVAGDLAASLSREGIDLVRWRAYEAVAADALPRAGADFLVGAPGTVLFFSARTAMLFMALAKDAGLTAHVPRHRAAVLSSAVADAIAGAGFDCVAVAAAPTSDDLIAALES